jgi:hypothetical protein
LLGGREAQTRAVEAEKSSTAAASNPLPTGDGDSTPVRAEDRGRLATTALTIFCTLNRQRLPSSQLPRVQAVAPAVVPLPSQLSTLPLGVCAGKVHLKGQHFNPGAGCYYYFRL